MLRTVYFDRRLSISSLGLGLEAFGPAPNGLVSPVWERAARPVTGCRSIRLLRLWVSPSTPSGSAYPETLYLTNATRTVGCGCYWTPTRTRAVKYMTPT